MKIYTYYADCTDLNRFDELKLITLWRERWNAVGLEPFVLNEHHARKHPLFAQLDQAVSNLPTSNPKQYERACYLRWLALATMHGGWMMDYDVMPRYKVQDCYDPGDGCDTASLPVYWFYKAVGRPWLLRDNVDNLDKIIVYQTPCCPALVHAPWSSAEQLCRSFIEGTELGNSPQDGRGHYSDQYHLESLVKNGDDGIRVQDVVKLWSDVGWEQAPIIHFANAVMGPAKKLPRWRNIPELLP